MVRDGDVASASNYVTVTGRLRAVGSRVQVYVDASDEAAGTASAALIGDVVQTFDGSVLPLAARTIGVARDADGDGRFTVLLSGWLARLAGGRHAVDGFVRGADLDPRVSRPFGNNCDMMYLSTALKPGPHLRTVIAHEYTHAVTFTAKSLNPARGAVPAEEEGWVEEGLAHLAEDLFGFSRSNVDYRVSAFLSEPERYRLVVPDYYAADLFRGHGNRGATYLFFRWCADRFGERLLPTLARSGRVGVAGVEAATGEAFADLYRAWSVDLFLGGSGFGDAPRRAFRSVDLRGDIAGWPLAGPRAETVEPGRAALHWSSAGTASRYVIVGPATAGAVEVEVEAAEGAGLQVTAVPLPDDLPRLEMDVWLAARKEGAEHPGLHVRVRETGGAPVRLASISWEPLVPSPDPRSAASRRGGLDAAGVEAYLGNPSLNAGEVRESGPIPLPYTAAARQLAPIVVKAVGTDSLGRRISAWAEVGNGKNPSPETGRGSSLAIAGGGTGDEGTPGTREGSTGR
jgi:hypothetical protein